MAILWHIKFCKGRKKGRYSAGPIKSFAEFLSYRCSLRLKIGKICVECLLFNGLFIREVAHFSDLSINNVLLEKTKRRLLDMKKGMQNLFRLAQSHTSQVL